jgi:hypothetical protein
MIGNAVKLHGSRWKQLNDNGNQWDFDMTERDGEVFPIRV